jgi:hypothetical protein
LFIKFLVKEKEKNKMEGYIRSLTTTWRHAFKQKVRPGGKVTLDSLYKTYGKKYSIKESDFIGWLKTVKLSSTINTWEIVELDEDTPEDLVVAVNKEDDVDIALSKLSVEDVVKLPVRKAREVIPNITDVKLLKYALQEAKPRANKESLCRILDKRIQEVSLLRSA